MAHLESLEDRRRWQNSVTETLFVAVVSGPGGTDPAEFALALGTELASIEHPRRTLPSVALWEGDFWAPRLAAWLRRFEKKDRAKNLFCTEGWDIYPPEITSQDGVADDFFDLYEKISENSEARKKLDRTNGIPPTDSVLERWREELLETRRIEPTRLETSGTVADDRRRRERTLLTFPARSSQSGFQKLLERGPRRLVVYPTDAEGEIPGMAVARGLLAVTARELGAGIVLLTLPQSWNGWTLMAINRIADILVFPFDEFTGKRPLEAAWLPFLETISAFLLERRPQYAMRPHFEKNFLFSLAENKPPDSILRLGETISLPSVAKGPKKKSSAYAQYLLRLQALARRVDLQAASKAAGVEQAEFEDDYDPDKGLATALRDFEDRSIRIRVEQGTYGEKPIEDLGSQSAKTGPLKGLDFEIEPRGIDHHEWFWQTVRLTSAEYDEDLYRELLDEELRNDGRRNDEEEGRLADGEKPSRPVEAERKRLEERLKKEEGEEGREGKPLDLIAFPYYMLGALAENDLILPLHALGDCLEPGTRERDNLAESTLTRGFHWVDDTCRYQGVLYAAPYIFTQKLLLVKKRTNASDAPSEVANNWDELRDQFKENKEGWPLLLETAAHHVGVWYDWLEMVFAHGSNDFLRSGERLRMAKSREGAGGSGRLDFRASDYGECELTAQSTIKATKLYLELLHQSREQLKELRGDPEVDWDSILPVFRDEERFWATVVWSDMAAFHWRTSNKKPDKDKDKSSKDEPMGLEDWVRAYAFPPATGEGRVSVEGWVLGVPAYLGKDKRRLRLVAHFLAWFLDPRIQIRFAEAGGSTARSDVGHALGEIPRLVHRTVSNAAIEPALKITFREAPAVIEKIRRAIVTEWIGKYPETDFLEQELRSLAQELVTKVLRNKARFRDKDYWSEHSREDRKR